MGNNLLQVMEIMYHNNLRSKPISLSRPLDHPKIYGNETEFQRYMRFALRDLRKESHVNWSIVNGTNGMPLFPNYAHDEPILFENRAEYLSNDEKDDILRDLSKRYQINRMILLCSGPGEGTSCTNKFEPVLTDLGICFTFNGETILDLMKNSSYLDAFQEVYEPSRSVDPIIKNKGHGKSSTLFMVLDSHKSVTVLNG
jgi:hypothetical protein